jgi:hypothetical protein
MERINSSMFDWLTWRSGTILELFNIPQRKYSLISNKNTLRKYAIGWAPAETIPCRPKADKMAVMFLFNERMFWTHLSKEEFEVIFNEKEEFNKNRLSAKETA